MAGCIPVILADEIELPYEDSVDWREATVKIPEARAGATRVSTASPSHAPHAR